MTQVGRLTPDCNFEVEWKNLKKKSLQNEKDVFRILKKFLWYRTNNHIDTYPMFDLKISDNDNNEFEENYINQGLLIPNPTKDEPFQIIHEHMLEDASYTFDYFNKKSKLDIEYKTYDNQKFLINISQDKKNCNYDFLGDGGTFDQYLSLRYLNSENKIITIRSSSFANLPLELNKENKNDYIEELKEISYSFFNTIIKK